MSSKTRIDIRRATSSDVADLVRISAKFRSELAGFQPQFWRVAEGADEKQHGFFEFVISQDKMVVLVAESETGIQGFLMAAFVPAPPVYDPGGLTCLVDDFGVKNTEDWIEIGEQLLNYLSPLAKEKGCNQMVIICPQLHLGKRSLLSSLEFSVASEWWVRGLP